MYAVNLADLSNTPAGRDIGICLILDPVIERAGQTIVTHSSRWDEVAIPLRCDPERARAIVQLIRKKYTKYQLRLYHSESGRGNWRRI